MEKDITVDSVKSVCKVSLEEDRIGSVVVAFAPLACCVKSNFGAKRLGHTNL